MQLTIATVLQQQLVVQPETSAKRQAVWQDSDRSYAICILKVLIT